MKDGRLYLNRTCCVLLVARKYGFITAAIISNNLIIDVNWLHRSNIYSARRAPAVGCPESSRCCTPRIDQTCSLINVAARNER